MSTTADSREFLEVPRESAIEKLFNEVLESENISLNLNKDELNNTSKAIKPTPGFCIKVKDDASKIFINICHCPELPKPADISESELAEILNSDEPSSYRVPLSLGEPHNEKDKGGNECMAYDVIVNSEFFEQCKENELFQEFLITLSCEGVQEKYNLNLKLDSCILLKNKLYHGTMPSHHIKNKPCITELKSTYKTSESANDVKNEDKKEKTVIPNYVLKKVPASGYPRSLILDVSLPNVVSGTTVSVSVGEDRILVFEKGHSYSIDIYLPYFVVQNLVAADFNVCKKVLTVTLPVVPEDRKAE